MKALEFSYINIIPDNQRKSFRFNFKIITKTRNINLQEVIKFPNPLLDNSVVNNLLELLHIALGISYYKLLIPPKISHPYAMDSDQANFWNVIFQNGLGEFLLRNKLSIDNLARFYPKRGLPSEINDPIVWEDSALLGIGGGKDSIVAGELLKEIGIDVTGFVLATKNNLGQAQAVTNMMEIPLTAINRSIDEQLLELNRLPSTYNGHIPISVIFAITGTILAATNKSKYVVVANESSASIPRAEWKGQSINHQWSKSLEFEKLFQNYLNTHISKDLTYFSAVRPLSSVAVAKIFSEYPKYFNVFTSDNSIFKIIQNQRSHPRWSKESSKSLSSYILLSPWITQSKMEQIFGDNYLNDLDSLNMLTSLLGAGEKPILDCVGTPEELQLSLKMTHSQYLEKSGALLTYANQHNLLSNAEKLEDALILHDHSIPKLLKPKLIKKMKEKI